MWSVPTTQTPTDREVVAVSDGYGSDRLQPDGGETGARSVDGTDGPTITFGPSAAETVIQPFGWETDAEGTITDESGEPVDATDGEPIEITELGGIVPDESGEPTPIRDDFVSISEFVKSRQDDAGTDHGTIDCHHCGATNDCWAVGHSGVCEDCGGRIETYTVDTETAQDGGRDE